MSRTSIAASLVLAVAANANSHATDDAAVQRGHAVFKYWCAACHGAGERNPGTMALQAKYAGAKPAALEERRDLTPTVTKSFVRLGVSVMAPFRKTEISDADLDAVAAYLARRRP